MGITDFSVSLHKLQARFLPVAQASLKLMEQFFLSLWRTGMAGMRDPTQLNS